MIRIFDIFFSLFGLVFLSFLLLVILIIGWSVSGSPIFLQTRVGRYQKPFTIIKFRTMHPDTDSVATHLLDVITNTPFENFLRRTKIDELPQLWNVLRGEMSLVGPRPCLYNQYELISERLKLNIFNFRPGITGLAQIKRIDMSTPLLLAQTEAQMLSQLNTFNYFKYIFLTIFGKGRDDNVKEINEDN